MASDVPARPPPGPFGLRDCTLLSVATGLRAQTLKELRDGLLSAPVNSIYHHFWGRLLRPRLDEPEYTNDFASWAYHALHETALAERLSMMNPADFDNLEQLRQEVVEIAEQRLEESDWSPWARLDQQFHFLEARIVIFDTGVRLKTPESLSRALPELPTGSIYYHFIDARRRTARGRDDFSVWLSGFGDEYRQLVARMEGLDPYFSSLKEVRYLLAEIFRTYAGG